jgi:hypothetical protein
VETLRENLIYALPRDRLVRGARELERPHGVAGLQSIHLRFDDVFGRRARLWPSDVGARGLEKAAVLGSQRCGTRRESRSRRERCDSCRKTDQQREAAMHLTHATRHR